MEKVSGTPCNEPCPNSTKMKCDLTQSHSNSWREWRLTSSLNMSEQERFAKAHES